jgi:hypothetical protein
MFASIIGSMFPSIPISMYLHIGLHIHTQPWGILYARYARSICTNIAEE